MKKFVHIEDAGPITKDDLVKAMWGAMPDHACWDVAVSAVGEIMQRVVLCADVVEKGVEIPRHFLVTRAAGQRVGSARR